MFGDIMDSMKGFMLSGPLFIDKLYSPESFLKTYLGLATGLDGREISILSHMIMEADNDGIYHGTYDNLIEKFGLSRMTISSVLRTLQTDGFISKVKEGWQISENVSIPCSNGSIVINFKNSNSTSSLVKSTNISREELDISDFVNFLDALIISRNKLSLGGSDCFCRNSYVVKEIAKTFAVEYNAQCNSEGSLGFDSFVRNRVISVNCKGQKGMLSQLTESERLELLGDDIAAVMCSEQAETRAITFNDFECIKDLVIEAYTHYVLEYASQHGANYVADFQNQNGHEFFNSYKNWLKSLNLDNSSMMVATEFFMNIAHISGTLSFNEILKLLNPGGTFGLRDIARKMNGCLSAEEMEIVLRASSNPYMTPVRAAMNMYAAEHTVINYGDFIH